MRTALKTDLDAGHSQRLRAIASDLPLCQASVRAAFEQGQFSLAYQPIVRTQDGRTVGCEALLRWTHPQRGAQDPAQFVPVLARSRQMLDVGDWVLREAATQVMAWRKGSAAELRLSINVSPVQVCAPDFAARVTRLLEASSLPPECLALEVTQDLLSEHGYQAGTTLARLAMLGVEIHLDDFAGGPSMLTQLQALAVSGFKLDRRFIRELHNGNAPRNEVRMLTGMAQQLGLRVIAEGIERDTELSTMAELGVTEAQGFLFCAPLPAAAFDSFLTAQGVGGD